MVRKGLMKKGYLKQSLEGDEGVNQIAIQGKSIPGEILTSAKALWQSMSVRTIRSHCS